MRVTAGGAHIIFWTERVLLSQLFITNIPSHTHIGLTVDNTHTSGPNTGDRRGDLNNPDRSAHVRSDAVADSARRHSTDARSRLPLV